jgi:hypothetical protein
MNPLWLPVALAASLLRLTFLTLLAVPVAVAAALRR